MHIFTSHELHLCQRGLPIPIHPHRLDTGDIIFLTEMFERNDDDLDFSFDRCRP